MPERIGQKELERQVIFANEEHPDFGRRKIAEYLKLPLVEQFRIDTILRNLKSKTLLPSEKYQGQHNAELCHDVEVSESPISPADNYQRRIENRDAMYGKYNQELGEYILESLTGAVAAMPVPKAAQKKIPYDLNQGDEELCAVISDSHTLQVITSDEIGGLGNYNAEIFERRLEFYYQSLLKIIARHSVKKNPYRVLNFFFDGDIVEGDGHIFPGQMLRMAGGIGEQILYASDKFSWLVGSMAATGLTVNCFCIPGNHGRIGKKGEHGPTDNYDYLTYHLMKERLRQYPNVNFCIPKSMFMLVEVQGRIFYMTHGGEVRSWMGIPYYGLDRARSRIVEMMAEHEVYPDYFITAHVHQQTTIKERHFTNGDWAGGNDFSVGKLNQASRPMQFLFSVHKDYGVTWRTPILLENPTIKKNIKIFKGGQNGKSNRASK